MVCDNIEGDASLQGQSDIYAQNYAVSWPRRQLLPFNVKTYMYNKNMLL
jgi:ABC-type amino acid transport substrate-binding protein